MRYGKRAHRRRMEDVVAECVCSPLMSDGVVFQRGVPLRVWGRARPGERVEVRFRGHVAEGWASPTGEWEVELPPQDAGGPFSLEVRCGGVRQVVRDVLVGDVWLLGGQSNMELPVRRTLDLFGEEVRDARCPFIREFVVPLRYHFHGPLCDLEGGSWKEVTPETVLEFGALGYFFARHLYERYGVPIGLVRAAAGGTPIEAWLAEEVLEAYGVYREELARCKDDASLRALLAENARRIEQWHAELSRADEGLRSRPPWWSEEYDDREWEEHLIPGVWDGPPLGGFCGSIWFRREMLLPVSPEGGALLRLGAIIDADEVYVNGVAVGRTGYRYPPRTYPIPEGVLRKGRNLIAVRVVVHRGHGGWVPGKPYRLEYEGGRLELSGVWKRRIGVEMPPCEEQIFPQYKPAGLYNGMIAPLRRFPIRGVLWYQGESNTARPHGYAALLADLISLWRRTWGRDDLPFLYVQLANFEPFPWEQGRGLWPVLREEQRKALRVPGTAMVVTIDVGESNDLHPQDKKTVGERLALCARALSYGEEITYQGPLAREVVKEGDALIVVFDHVDGGLLSKGDVLEGFELRTPDGRWVHAQATIVDGRVNVRHPEVPAPTAVRYAWADDPVASLYNRAGLPASPFVLELG
ncbi:putative sialic acid-specific 9-O-acetylesterase [Spirochaeta thermophila DSM 6192]|uniref:Putative sialic acid-specific 9-O-acetylesterase n=2 Tax=Winmispira thermophila TaxID=154 RepID=E0RNJ1_WINT6|nr:putative sialic acid-specific 9-O-acetylesterase [Spirochaeta thermophila DSM 6192]